MEIKLGVAVGFDRLNDVIKAGYDYIEPALNSLFDMNEEQFDKLCALVDASNIKAEVFNCFFPHKIKIVGDSFDLPTVTEYAEKVLERAHRLGSRICVLGSGFSRRIPDGFSHGDAVEQMCLVLNECGRIAKKYNIDITLEPLNSGETNFINTFSEAFDLCERVNMENVKCLIDFYHVSKMGDTLPDVCTENGVIRHIHVAGATTRTMKELREDTDTLVKWKKALEKYHYNGGISIEGRFDDDFFNDINKTRKAIRAVFSK